MRACPFCGEISDHHIIGGEHCLQRLLVFSEGNRASMAKALREFRHQLHHDPHISEDTRLTVIGHLDAALMENQHV